MAKQSETDIVVMALKALSRMPEVVEAWRQNTGAMKDRYGHFIRFGRIGDPDITGFMKNGLRLDIEWKLPGKWPAHTDIDEWLAGEAKLRASKAAKDKKRYRIVRQREYLRSVWLSGGHSGVLMGLDELPLVVGPSRSPERLWEPGQEVIYRGLRVAPLPDTSEPPF